MKIFQITHKYDPYINYFEEKYGIKNKQLTFKELIELLIFDGFYGPHILKPIFDQSPLAFYTMWNYERLQHQWAKENNLETLDLKEILIHQIKTFSPEVIYNMSPQLISHNELSGFNFNPKITCWNADAGAINDSDLNKYDALLTSSMLKLKNQSNGFLAYPSKEPNMHKYIGNEKKIDVFFYGQYNSHLFKERQEYVNELIPFFKKNNISFKFALMYHEEKSPYINRRFLRNIPLLQKVYPPKKISKYFSTPLFGKDIYKDISESRITFNISGGLSVFGNYKFNMRIFETLGVGTFMLSDKGKYPNYIEDGQHFIGYENMEDLQEKIKYYLANEQKREKIAKQGNRTVNEFYSKEKQWENFKNIVSKI